jgi:hypothetical protein
MVLRLGALPLGVRTGAWPFRSWRRLNVGFVNAKNRSGVREVRSLIGSQKDWRGIEVYRVDAAEALEVLHRHYGLDRAALLAMPEGALEPALRRAAEASSTAETP